MVGARFPICQGEIDFFTRSFAGYAVNALNASYRGGGNQLGWMPANFTTWAQRSVSSAMNLAKSAGEPP